MAAAVLLAVGGVTAAAEFQLERDSAWARHSHEVLSAYGDISVLHQHAVSAQRGYLLSGGRAFELEYWQAREQALSETADLQRLVGDNPAQSERVRLLAQTLKSRLDIAASGIGARKAGGVEAAQAFLEKGEGLALDVKLAQVGGDIRRQEGLLLEERKRSTERRTREVFISALLGIPFSLLILGIVYRLLSREQAVRREAEGMAAGVNWELSRSVAQLESLSARLRQLASYTGMLQSCNDTEEALDISKQALSRLLAPAAGTVYLLRASKDHAEGLASWGEHQVQSHAMPKPGDCWALRRNQPYFLADLQGAVRCAHVEPLPGQEAATACIPLSAQGETLGWLFLSAGKGELPDQHLMLSVSEQMSLALANLRLKEKLRQQSIRDPLTGLFNRRYLEESLERELARCERRSLPLTLLMLDMDHFKSFNDTHGHPGGDALLSAFGQLLVSLCRQEDLPCRFGGEEFMLILPEMGLEDSMERAEAIRKAVLALSVQHQGKALSPVTVSIGLACFPDHGRRVSELIELADEALYRAKAAGRNRVLAAPIP